MLVFVYGTLKKDHCRGSVLRGQKFLGEVETTDEYIMHDLGAFPAIVKEKSKNGNGVKGELYEIDNSLLKRLDAIEGYPFLYTREEINLKDDERKPISYLFAEPNKIKGTKIIVSGIWSGS